MRLTSHILGVEIIGLFFPILALTYLVCHFATQGMIQMGAGFSQGIFLEKHLCGICMVPENSRPLLCVTGIVRVRLTIVIVEIIVMEVSTMFRVS
jgi:hypothetical protein